MFFPINHLHGLAENVGHDQKGEEKMEKVRGLVEFKHGQGVLGIELGNIPYGQKSSGLRRYCRLISESVSLEEACVLVLGMPNLANTRPYSSDFHNSFYCLAQLTQSPYREIAICATWAILGTGFYNSLLKIGMPSIEVIPDEFYCIKPTPPDDDFLNSAIAQIQIFLGESGTFFNACPKISVRGRMYHYIQRLVPEAKYDEAAKRFLKATCECPQAGRALLKFRLFEELVRGEHFAMLPELGKFICEGTIPGKVLTIEQVESMVTYSSMRHACSAWRGLEAMQKRENRK